MRALLPLLAALSACAARAPAVTTAPSAAAAPTLTPHTLSIGTIATAPGSVERIDSGIEGMVSVEVTEVGGRQQLDWMGAVPSREQQASVIWSILRGVLAQGGASGIPEAPTLGASVVAEQPAVTWEMVVGEESAHLALWSCPAVGATAWFVTAGPDAWARAAHAASLATATCGTEAASLAPAAIAWEPTAGPEWVAEPVAEPDRALWKRADGAADAHVFVSTGAPEGGTEACGSAMDAGMEAYRAPFAVVPGSIRARSAGLCSRSFEGSLEGAPIRAVLTQYVCRESSGYLTFCVLFDPNAPLDTCDSVVRCRAD